MDFYKNQQSKDSNSNQHPKLDEYKAATPIVPVHGTPPQPVAAKEYARANQPRRISEPADMPDRKSRGDQRNQDDDYQPRSVLGNIWRLLTVPFRLGCQGCGCLILVFIVCFVAFAVYLFTSKPAFLWNPLVNLANGSVQSELAALKSAPQIPFEEATAQLSNQTAKFNIGTNQLIINQLQLQAVIDKAFKGFVPNQVYARIDNGEVKLLWNIDTTLDQGLWMVLKLGIDQQNKLVVKHIGFNSISLPEFLNKMLTDGALTGLRMQSGRDINEILDTILNLPDSVSVKNVQIVPNQLIVNVELKSGLDNLFN